MTAARPPAPPPPTCTPRPGPLSAADLGPLPNPAHRHRRGRQPPGQHVSGDFGAVVDLTSPDDPDTVADDIWNNRPALAVDAVGDVTVIWGAEPEPFDSVTPLRSRVLDVDEPAPAAQVPTPALAPALPTPALPTPPSPAVDTVAPVLSKVRVEPKALPAPRAATVRVSSSGGRQGDRGRAAPTGGRWKTVGRKQWSVTVGANTEKLYGKAAEVLLRPGTYRVRLTATDLQATPRPPPRSASASPFPDGSARARLPGDLGPLSQTTSGAVLKTSGSGSVRWLDEGDAR